MGYGDAVLNRGFVAVSVDIQLKAVRHQLEGLYGRNPDGVILLGIDHTVRMVDAVACQVLGIDPVESLGKILPPKLGDITELPEEETLIDTTTGEQPYLFRRNQTEFGEVISIWMGLDTVQDFDPEEEPDDSGPVDYLEPMLSQPTREALLDWVGRTFERDCDGQRGAVVIRDGKSLVLHVIWPASAPLLLPLRFPAEESQAFRTAHGGRAIPQTEPILGESNARIEPLVQGGQVIGLVVWEGDQPMVNRLIPFLPLALRRFLTE